MQPITVKQTSGEPKICPPLAPTCCVIAMPRLFSLLLIACCCVACGDDDNQFKPTTTAPPTQKAQLGTCTDDLNPNNINAPSDQTELDNYRFELASTTLRTIEGTVISSVGITDPKPIDRAVFIGTGAFLSDGCITTQNGTSFQWKGVACQDSEGTLYNALLVDQDVFLKDDPEFKAGAKIRISGYEIEKFNDYAPGGGFWQDGGDNNGQGQISFWLTNVCLIDQ